VPDEDFTAAPTFDDLVAANAAYADSFALTGLKAHAARGLAVVTCMDSRIEPLNALGLRPGDAKIMRNAGARVTEDVLRTLVLAVHLLGVDRILVMPHSRCAMAGQEEAAVHEDIDSRTGLDTRSLEFRTVTDQVAALDTDLQRIRSWPWIPVTIPVAGAVYDVDTGRLGPLRSPAG
jgi:carbonic anhydrase